MSVNLLLASIALLDSQKYAQEASDEMRVRLFNW
jgi:hypothetical protein